MCFNYETEVYSSLESWHEDNPYNAAVSFILDMSELKKFKLYLSPTPLQPSIRHLRQHFSIFPFQHSTLVSHQHKFSRCSSNQRIGWLVYDENFTYFNREFTFYLNEKGIKKIIIFLQYPHEIFFSAKYTPTKCTDVRRYERLLKSKFRTNRVKCQLVQQTVLVEWSSIVGISSCLVRRVACQLVSQYNCLLSGVVC